MESVELERRLTSDVFRAPGGTAPAGMLADHRQDLPVSPNGKVGNRSERSRSVGEPVSRCDPWLPSAQCCLLLLLLRLLLMFYSVRGGLPTPPGTYRYIDICCFARLS